MTADEKRARILEKSLLVSAGQGAGSNTGTGPGTAGAGAGAGTPLLLTADADQATSVQQQVVAGMDAMNCATSLVMAGFAATSILTYVCPCFDCL